MPVKAKEVCKKKKKKKKKKPVEAKVCVGGNWMLVEAMY